MPMPSPSIGKPMQPPACPSCRPMRCATASWACARLPAASPKTPARSARPARASRGRSGKADAAPSVSFVQANAVRNRIMGVRSFAGSIAEDAGLQRPPSQRFAGNSQDISGELLDQADADWIFYAARDKSLPGLTGSPLWPRLRGAAQGHAVRVGLDPFYLNAGPLAARTVLSTLARTAATALPNP